MHPAYVTYPEEDTVERCSSRLVWGRAQGHDEVYDCWLWGCTGLCLSQVLNEKIYLIVSGSSMFWLNVQCHMKRVFTDLGLKTHTKLWCQCKLSMTNTLQQLPLVSNLKAASFRMVYLFSLLGDTHIFENKFQSECPLGSHCLFDKVVCVPTREIIYREKNQTMQKTTTTTKSFKIL